jgi:hypothetical protein
VPVSPLSATGAGFPLSGGDVAVAIVLLLALVGVAVGTRRIQREA